MDLTIEYITTELEGFYPNSWALTPKILGEMYAKLNRLGWTQHDFDRALRLYRDAPERLETKTIHTPPDVRQLIRLHDKKECYSYSFPCKPVPPPEWNKGAMAAFKEDGRLGLAIYMLAMCDRYPQLHREWWEAEMEYLQTRECPKVIGNLGGVLVPA